MDVTVSLLFFGSSKCAEASAGTEQVLADGLCASLPVLAVRSSWTSRAVPPLGLVDASQPCSALVFLLSVYLGRFYSRLSRFRLMERSQGHHVALMSPGPDGHPGGSV